MYQSNLSYNVSIAKKIGVVCAILVSVIDSSIMEDDKVMLSREYIFNRSGIDEQAQEEAEEKLKSIGVLKIRKSRGSDDKNYYTLNYEKLGETFCSPDSAVESLVSVKTPKQKKMTKKEAVIVGLKRSVSGDIDPVIKQYIFDWIDSVIESGNYLTKQSVSINIKQLIEFSKNQKDLIDVLQIATKNSYRDLSWAMDRVKKSSIVEKSGRNFANYPSIKFEDDLLSGESF